jgi:hypothetical protein
LTNPAFALKMARRFIRLDFLIPKKSKKTRRRYLTNRRRTTTGAPAPKFFVNQKISGGLWERPTSRAGFWFFRHSAYFWFFRNFAKLPECSTWNTPAIGYPRFSRIAVSSDLVRSPSRSGRARAERIAASVAALVGSSLLAFLATGAAFS